MLKKLFNDEIKKLNSTRVGEVRLFECLKKALQNYPSIKTHICHQHYIKTCYMRELCDLFVMIVNKDYLRYAFIQHKYSRNLYYKGLCDFEIECGQHRILVEKPPIQVVGTSLVSDILSSSKYDTITAYSVFFKDDKGEFDLDFASANSVVCRNKNNFLVKSDCGKMAIHQYPSIHWNKKNSLIDYDSLLNISEILKNHEFGEVIYKNDDSDEQVEKKLTLSSFASQFDFGEEVKEVLKNFDLEIFNNKSNYYEEPSFNDKNNLQYLMQQFYVKEMLVIDLTNDANYNKDIRKV